MDGATTYRLEEHEVVASARLAFRKSLFRYPILLLIGAIYGLVGLFFLLANDAQEQSFPIAIAVAVPAAILLAYSLLLPRQARRHFRQTSGLHDEVQASWNAEGLSLEMARGSLRMDWSDFYRWTENDEVMLLYQSERLYNMIPKRALDEGAESAIRRALESTGTKKL